MPYGSLFLFWQVISLCGKPVFCLTKLSFFCKLLIYYLHCCSQIPRTVVQSLHVRSVYKRWPLTRSATPTSRMHSARVWFGLLCLHAGNNNSGKVAIWSMAPVQNENAENDENVPKLICQMDNHLGMCWPLSCCVTQCICLFQLPVWEHYCTD